MAKNECAKTRKPSEPYEVWQSHCDDDGNRWVWKVLKKYQSPEAEVKNLYARWLCFVMSPYCPEGEMGDVYVSTIKGQAKRVK